MNLSDGGWAAAYVCVAVRICVCVCVALTAKTNVPSSSAEKYAMKIAKTALKGFYSMTSSAEVIFEQLTLFNIIYCIPQL